MVRALGRVVEQGIIACDHGGVDACLQVSQPTQHMEGPPTDRLEDRGNVRMEGKASMSRTRTPTSFPICSFFT